MPKKKLKAIDSAELARRKREKLEAAAIAAKQRVENSTRRRYESASLKYDPRLATGRRELQMDHMAEGGFRARTLRYDALFRNKADAKAERVLACQMYDELFHAASAGAFPTPKFEPQVDTSHSPSNPIEGPAAAGQKLSALRQRLGIDAAAIFHFRVVENWSLRALANEGGSDERRVSALFMGAADAAARFFRLAPEATLVTRMQALAA